MIPLLQTGELELEARKRQSALRRARPKLRRLHTRHITQEFDEKRKEGHKCWKAWTLEFDDRIKDIRERNPPEDPAVVKARKEKGAAEKDKAANEAFKAWWVPRARGRTALLAASACPHVHSRTRAQRRRLTWSSHDVHWLRRRVVSQGRTKGERAETEKA